MDTPTQEVDKSAILYDQDLVWQARTGLNPQTLAAAIEAIVFMSERPISLDKIKEKIDPDLPLRALHRACESLIKSYESSTRGIRIMEVGGGLQFRTKPAYTPYLKNLFKVKSLVLGPSAIEVLAVVAYKQPIARTEVDKIRGVDSSHLVRMLMDKRLISSKARSQELGKQLLLGTTQEFLEIFGLNSLDDLPPEYELNDLLAESEVGEITDIKSMIRDTHEQIGGADEMQELDSLTGQIKSISADTSFTKMLKNNFLSTSRKDDEKKAAPKTSFDILEEFLLREKITQEMTLACQSSYPLELDPQVATTEDGEGQEIAREKDETEGEGASTLTKKEMSAIQGPLYEL